MTIMIIVWGTVFAEDAHCSNNQIMQFTPDKKEVYLHDNNMSHSLAMISTRSVRPSSSTSASICSVACHHSPSH
jgi:hypothetical protein